MPQHVGGHVVKSATFQGEYDDAFLGKSAEFVPDLNGDAIPEILIGAPQARKIWPGPKIGKAYVYSGAFLNPLIFSWEGEYEYSNFGESVASAGDVNLDGKADFLIGASGGYGATRNGVVFVYSGMDGSLIYRLEGAVGERFGGFVKGLGDLDLDGYSDFMVGALTDSAFGSNFGSMKIFSGRTGALKYEVGGPWYGNGRCGDAMGDTNQDGYPDFIVGDQRNGGSVALHSGVDGEVLNRWFDPHGFDGNFGVSVARVADLDGDQVSDFLVGANEVDPWGGAYSFSSVTGNLLHEYAPEYSIYVTSARFGTSVGNAGDVNGDGIPDVVIGDDNFDHVSDGSGAISVYSGFDQSRIWFQSAYRNQTFVAFNFGQCVDGGGDTNQDGISEILVGAPKSSTPTGGYQSGSLLKVFLSPWMTVDPTHIYASSGGIVTFRIYFYDEQEGGKDYMLLASSDRPGRAGGFNYICPLAQSPILVRMLLNPLNNFDAPMGTLDSGGRATVHLTLAPGESAAAIGRTFKFSAVTLNPNGEPSLASAGVSFEILP